MNKNILSPLYRFAGSENYDTQIRISFEEEKNLLKNDDRDVVLNLSQQFYDEKNSCYNYKIFGKIRMIFRNLYYGESKYEYLREKLSLLPNQDTGSWDGYIPYNEYAFLRNDVYHEETIIPSMNTLLNFSGFTVMATGDTRHTTITTIDAPKYNWNFYLSYVYTHDENYPMKYTLSGETQPHISFVASDGIVFRVEENDYYYILTSPVKHGMNEGEYVIISGNPYFINSVGNEVYNSEFYTLYISKAQITGETFNTLVTGKRCTDINNISDNTSQYYVHKHKTLTDINSYIIDNIGFESPIFEDEKKVISVNSSGINDIVVERNRMESIIYDFSKPFVLSGLTNNLGYTPNEIYLTTIFRNGDGYYLYPPKIGYSFNFHDSWVDLHFSGNTSSETGITGSIFNRTGDTGTVYTFMSGNTIPIGTSLYGDFIEYIPNELKERVISETFHKITINPTIFDHGQTDSLTYSGATEDNPIGLYYQTHYPIKLRELSSYVETSNTKNILNLPDNAKYFPNEKLWKWRDVFDLGYINEDGNNVDFTYMNDMLYVHRDINFYLRNEKQFKNKKDGIIKFKDGMLSTYMCEKNVSSNPFLVYFPTLDTRIVATNPTNITNNDGSIIVTINKGTPNYTYELYVGQSIIESGITSGNTYTFNNLIGDMTYTIKVHDSENTWVRQDLYLMSSLVTISYQIEQTMVYNDESPLMNAARGFSYNVYRSDSEPDVFNTVHSIVNLNSTQTNYDYGTYQIQKQIDTFTDVVLRSGQYKYKIDNSYFNIKNIDTSQTYLYQPNTPNNNIINISVSGDTQLISKTLNRSPFLVTTGTTLITNLDFSCSIPDVSYYFNIDDIFYGLFTHFSVTLDSNNTLFTSSTKFKFLGVLFDLFYGFDSYGIRWADRTFGPLSDHYTYTYLGAGVVRCDYYGLITTESGCFDTSCEADLLDMSGAVIEISLDGSFTHGENIYLSNDGNLGISGQQNVHYFSDDLFGANSNSKYLTVREYQANFKYNVT